jgi:hypothetical protein
MWSANPPPSPGAEPLDPDFAHAPARLARHLGLDDGCRVRIHW